jgi:hypothetical protein
MLSPAQLEILRGALDGLTARLSFNEQRKAWHIDAVMSLCVPYDRSIGLERFHGAEAFYRLMVQPGLMSVSPDGRWCKLTDYGRALYDETEAQQKDWEEPPIIPLEDAEKDQIIIKAGETFRGKFFVTQLFKRARAAIRLHDNFCSHEQLEWLYAVSAPVAIRILTSTRALKQDAAFESLYRAFANERRSAEMRTTADIHDRKIIIDDREAYQVGESLKDIGAKGTTIVRLTPVAEHVALFDGLWNAAKPL